MITIETVLGNISRNKDMKERFDTMSKKGAVERVRISRMEAERVRMRKATDMGTDLALTLTSGTRLRDGDVLMLAGSSRMIIIEQEREMVAVVKIRDENSSGLAVLVGHAIGNLHRPIKVINGDKICFPIQAKTELDMLKRQFSTITDHLEISMDEMVFEPDGVSTHEH